MSNTNSAAIPRGIANMGLWADDVDEASRWYTEVLGVPPYFVRPVDGPPQYAEFRIGDYQDELGIIDRRYAPASTAARPGGAVTSWHVDDISAAFERLLSLGAREYQPIVEHEAGFVPASVVDPFGNIFGLMHSPHYLEILDDRSAAD